MLLLNRTPLHAATVPNADDNDGIISLLVASATYDLGKDRLRFSEEQRPLALLADPPAIGDGYMTKAGTSVCATGFATGRAGGAGLACGATRAKSSLRAAANGALSGGGLLSPEPPPPGFFIDFLSCAIKNY